MIIVKFLRIFVFIVLGCQPFIFAAKPPRAVEDQSIICLRDDELNNEIKQVLSLCYEGQQFDAILTEEDDFSRGYGSEALRGRFVFYLKQRSERIKNLEKEDKVIISYIALDVKKIRAMYISLDPHYYSAYEREIQIYNEILLGMLVYLKKQFHLKKQLMSYEKKQEARFFIIHQLLPYAKRIFTLFSAFLKEKLEYDGDAASMYQELEQWYSLQQGTLKVSFEDFSESVKKTNENNQNIKLLWLRVIETLEKFVQERS